MAQTENEIEYVEFVDVPVQLDQDSESVQIIENDDNSENMSELITIADDTEQMDEVEYIEAEELDENHTIIVHEGKQYVIPTDQLQQAGNTIILEGDSDENGQETSEPLFENNSEDENVYFGEVTSDVSEHYAVLKDGKLHINDSTSEMQDKLRVLEQSLNNFDSNEEENDENDSSQEEDELLSQITGKNLLTGQKISLTGFLEKLKRKNVDTSSQSRKSLKQANSEMTGDYVLVPPVNRRVVVGKTPDGKKLIGRILQIQKKISPAEVAQQTPRKTTQRASKPRERAPTESTASTPTSSTQIPPKCSPLLDENVSRTLAGLMDLESVCKSLIGRRLIVRHVQRRSLAGKSLSSSRKVAYYTGKMLRNTDNNNWLFNADEPNTQTDDNNIDLNVNSTDTQQLDVNISESGVVFNVKEEETDNSEPIILYLTVTQDEFGKKRTKVSIPQLANSCVKKCKAEENVCEVCKKKFQTAASLRRHSALHDPQCLGDETRLACASCGKTFAQRAELIVHARVHAAAKQFRCGVCAKTFHRHSNLQRHQDVHRQSDARRPDARPYVCHVCGCQYNFVSSLTRHIVMHHMNVDQTDHKHNE